MNAIDLFQLRGKNALVTGGSSGIGKQVALAYAQAGAAVALAGRHQDTLQDVAAEIAAEGGQAITVACDVTEAEQVTAMLSRVTEELGGVDIAVCNAGIISQDSLLDMSLEEFQRIQNTNVNGVFLTAQAAAKLWSPSDVAAPSSPPHRCRATSSTSLNRSAITARRRPLSSI